MPAQLSDPHIRLDDDSSSALSRAVEKQSAQIGSPKRGSSSSWISLHAIYTPCGHVSPLRRGRHLRGFPSTTRRECTGPHYAGTYGNQNVYRLVSAPGGDWSKAVCLAAPGAHPVAGAAVDTYGCDPNYAAHENQLWFFEAETYTHSTLGTQQGLAIYDLAALQGVGGDPTQLAQAPRLTIADPTSGPITAAPKAGDGLVLAATAWNRVQRQLWNLTIPSPAASPGGGGGPSPRTCSGFGCLFAPIAQAALNRAGLHGRGDRRRGRGTRRRA